MKKYTIPCVWKVYGYMEIEAESIHQAIDIAKLDDTPLPKESSYIEGSFWVDHDNILEVFDYEENDIFEK